MSVFTYILKSDVNERFMGIESEEKLARGGESCIQAENTLRRIYTGFLPLWRLG